MATTVTATYTPTLNVSVTTKDGVPTRVSLWQTGVPGSTQRPVDVPAVRFSHRVIR